MKETIGKYIGGVFCSMLRIATVTSSYYLVSADVDDVISCRIYCEQGNWIIEQQGVHPFFSKHLEHIVNLIIENERQQVLLAANTVTAQLLRHPVQR
jgi:hypothetical protein